MVTGKTKQEVRDKLRALHSELNVGLQSSVGYTVWAAVEDWLENGLSGGRRGRSSSTAIA